ncbi:hypothetical protein [Lewinella sp. 4G2]|uniref:hypothetical protein n=1 Tax=Lewinella sp. 4G2 TaxID=1803372 RepID=UPI0007B4D938|nr:hypothetical protein [Lewinella sp. 4G2]OAV46056.1 hypothetical protein A3850_017485 [Lewinella sp. 4G2]
MPNPYDDILKSEDGEQRSTPKAETSGFKPTVDLDDPRFLNTGPEPLDEILEDIEAFNVQAAKFSQLLSQLSVADHKVKSNVARMFFIMDDPQDRGSLAGERQYHALKEKKFRLIAAPMRELAILHLATVQQFNRDIDKNYYSVEKTDRAVQSDITRAINGINLQRRVLADACNNLQILHTGLKDTERRIKTYVNAGGVDNISVSEYELIVRQREELTSGREHHLDYEFFDVNLLDKTAISLGIYLKETSSQYLNKLERAVL